MEQGEAARRCQQEVSYLLPHFADPDKFKTNTKLTEKYEKVRQKLATSEVAQRRSSLDLKQLKKLNKTISADLTRTSTGLRDSEERRRKSENEKGCLEAELALLQKSYGALEASIAAKDAELGSTREQNQALEADNATLTADLHSMRPDLSFPDNFFSCDDGVVGGGGGESEDDV